MTTKRAGKSDATAVNSDGNADAAESQPTAADAPAARRDGLQIDGFGLPVNGIARGVILGKLKSDDPVKDEDARAAWNDETAGKARELTETTYG